jgi:hypothetical protein
VPSFAEEGAARRIETFLPVPLKYSIGGPLKNFNVLRDAVMTEEVLLSELCAIWSISQLSLIVNFSLTLPSHLSRPKYKCPRCTIQTCSVECVKRHKLWSQCSGARDPAAYRKRYQLATPSSFDQDFNFITRVERTIERAENVAQERGIALGEDRRKRAKGEARRDAETQQRKAIVLKAPAGMSRALQNKSKWDNRHKCLLWTVEWILDNGSNVLGNCQETRTIREAFANAVGKRKMRNQQSPAVKTTVSAQYLEPKSASESQQDNFSNPAALTEPASNVEHHFYLHRPNLPSNVRCVIPLMSDATIKDVMLDKVLVEFPTIFVLSISKEKLQEPFITEEEYIKQHGNVVSETSNFKMAGNKELLNSPGPALRQDEAKIKDEIQEDLGT